MPAIMGGAWAGRSLDFPKSEKLRPTAGRVKESIFSILSSIAWKQRGGPEFTGWACLDLFAGVGSLGLEALSRGADHCVFVEKDRKHGSYLKKNIKTLDCGVQTQVLLEPFEALGWAELGPFDLVLLDPPYAYNGLQEILPALVKSKALKSGSVILFERDPKAKLAQPVELKLHSSRTLGPAGIDVFFRE